MAPQQINNLMHWVQVIMLFVVTALLSWVGVKVQSFSEFVAKTEQIDKRQDAQISDNSNSIKEQEKKTNDQEKRIYYMEAVMPQSKKNNRPSPMDGF